MEIQDENDRQITIVLTKEQALIFYGIESTRPFQINANLANVGDMLRHAREHREISVQLLSDKINLNPNVLRQLESNRYDSMAGETFIKGYINLIARELGADSEPILKVYEVQKRKNILPLEQETDTELEEHWGKRIVVAIVGFAMTIAFVVYYIGYSSGTDESTLGLEKQLDDIEIKETEEAIHSPISGSMQNLGDIGENLQPRNGQIILRAQTSTWVEIVDDLGVILYQDLVNANQTLELLGRPPYNLLIGDANAVEIEYQGESVNTSDSLDSEGVARFRLGDF